MQRETKRTRNKSRQHYKNFSLDKYLLNLMKIIRGKLNVLLSNKFGPKDERHPLANKVTFASSSKQLRKNKKWISYIYPAQKTRIEK